MINFLFDTVQLFQNITRGKQIQGKVSKYLEDGYKCRLLKLMFETCRQINMSFAFVSEPKDSLASRVCVVFISSNYFKTLMVDGKKSMKLSSSISYPKSSEVNKPTKNIVMKSLLSIYCFESLFYDITGLRFVKSSCHVNVVCSVGFHLKHLIKIVKTLLVIIKFHA